MNYSLKISITTLLVLSFFAIAPLAFAQDEASEDNNDGGVFSTLRERQIENRQEIAEKLRGNRDEVQEARRTLVSNLISNRHELAVTRLTRAAERLGVRIDMMTERGFATEEARELLDQASREIATAEDLIQEVVAQMEDIVVESEVTDKNREQLRFAFSEATEAIRTAQETLGDVIVALRESLALGITQNSNPDTDTDPDPDTDTDTNTDPDTETNENNE